uniref:Uncharacterized protein n=1 Tax=Arundo donax TaxID=35708 RepID=A0A0A9AR39_ARUDO
MRKRTTRASFADKLPSPPHVAAAGVGHDELLNLTPGPAAIPMAHGSPTPAPAKKRKNPLDTAAATKQQDDAILKNAAAALQEAMPSQADFAVHATDGVATSVPPKTKKKKKNKRSWQVRNPVALVLDFAEGAPLPSKDELLSTFRRLGFVINPEETDIAKEERSARVVFATRAEAEAAYSYAQTLGAMGPPFAAPRLQDLPPIMLNEPPPLPKLPLTDIRRNLDKMISSLNSTQAAKPAVGTLVGEMQRLLAKVDKMLQGASSTANHH